MIGFLIGAVVGGLVIGVGAGVAFLVFLDKMRPWG